VGEEKADVAKLLASLREAFASAAKAIDEYLEKVEAAEKYPSADITRGGGVYGRLIQKPNEVIAVPAEGLNIAVADVAIQRFLVPKVLDAVKQKHGVEYSLESTNGKLKAVRVKGALEQREIDRLKRALAWAFEKAAKR